MVIFSVFFRGLGKSEWVLKIDRKINLVVMYIDSYESLRLVLRGLVVGK